MELRANRASAIILDNPERFEMVIRETPSVARLFHWSPQAVLAGFLDAAQPVG